MDKITNLSSVMYPRVVVTGRRVWDIKILEGLHWTYWGRYNSKRAMLEVSAGLREDGFKVRVIPRLIRDDGHGS